MNFMSHILMNFMPIIFTNFMSIIYEFHVHWFMNFKSILLLKVYNGDPTFNSVSIVQWLGRFSCWTSLEFMRMFFLARVWAVAATCLFFPSSFSRQGSTRRDVFHVAMDTTSMLPWKPFGWCRPLPLAPGHPLARRKLTIQIFDEKFL